MVWQAVPAALLLLQAESSTPSVSLLQVSFCIVYLWVLGLYIYSLLLKRSRCFTTCSCAPRQAVRPRPVQPLDTLLLSWCCRAEALDGPRVKAHLSDPDIESKAQAALAETATLISHNGGTKQQQQSDSKQAGVLHNFWGSALFRCGQGATYWHPGLALTVGDGLGHGARQQHRTPPCLLALHHARCGLCCRCFALDQDAIVDTSDTLLHMWVSPA